RAAGLDGPALLEAARRVMVQSIHIGIALAGCVAVAAAWQVRRIAHIRLHRAPKVGDAGPQ
ncbi:hypothetical protein NCPPB3923_29165, partial [Burkholderia glumae]